MADFDAWQQNPYTKVLQASIANDYVPKGDAQLYEQRLRAVLDVVQRYLPPDGIDMDTAMGEIIGLVDPWPAGVMVDRHQTFCEPRK